MRFRLSHPDFCHRFNTYSCKSLCSKFRFIYAKFPSRLGHYNINILSQQILFGHSRLLYPIMILDNQHAYLLTFSNTYKLDYQDSNSSTWLVYFKGNNKFLSCFSKRAISRTRREYLVLCECFHKSSRSLSIKISVSEDGSLSLYSALATNYCYSRVYV